MCRQGPTRQAGANRADKPPRSRGGAGGFTLIELLVVLAILAVLMSILSATFIGLKPLIWRINCGSNQRQLEVAWGQFAITKGRLPVSNTGGTEAWQRSSDFGDTYQSITDGVLWPYVHELGLYRCQSSVYPYKVSYSISARLNGEASVAKTLHEVPDPAGTMVLIEEYDNRGYNMNSFLIDPVNYAWIDVVAGNHEGGDNLTFADGHVEYWKWKDPRTLTYAGGHWMIAPGSVDLQRLNRVYNLWP
ncbi:MAG: prepilin-type N-terminal cleavage/methylation domain-containing protein [Planctomycetota bacterium]|nr:prepilin-type N-terminal cleavage/methylation domain-containing protein [Planctomycetota bacterium]